MGRRKVDELRDKSIEDLIKMLNELYDEYMKYKRMIKSGGAPEKPGKIRVIRKTIARIYTILGERGVKL